MALSAYPELVAAVNRRVGASVVKVNPKLAPAGPQGALERHGHLPDRGTTAGLDADAR